MVVIFNCRSHRHHFAAFTYYNHIQPSLSLNVAFEERKIGFEKAIRIDRTMMTYKIRSHPCHNHIQPLPLLNVAIEERQIVLIEP